MPENPRTQSRETPNAALAFADYVAMGPGRSLRALHERYCQQDADKVPTRRFETLADWSVKYHWQERIEHAASDRAQRLLEEAAELDADTFLQTSRLLNERIKYSTRDHLDAVIKMRESVRKPAPKGGTSVNVKVSVEVRQLAEQMAEQLGIDPEELIREAELIASGAWGEGK